MTKREMYDLKVGIEMNTLMLIQDDSTGGHAVIAISPYQVESLILMLREAAEELRSE